MVLTGIAIFFLSRILERHLYKEEIKDKKIQRRVLFIIALALYILFNIVWVIIVKPAIGADQISVGKLAQTFCRGTESELLNELTYAGVPLSQYMQAYHQQISLAFVYSLIFRIIQCDKIEILRILNVISNIVTVFAIYKINQQLSKKYKTNKTLLCILMFTFISLPMLSTFVYGDIPSIALCLFSVYFMMRYTETKKWIYPIVASIFTMIAYMMRMNSLIFIIATVIYLLLQLWKEIRNKKTWKENAISCIIIIAYVGISILPSSLVKSYYVKEYNLDKNKEYPNSSYFLMAMKESYRSNGWYNEEIGEYALKNPEAARKEYPEKIKERLKLFAQYPIYAIIFYSQKVISTWTENTYAAIDNNITDEAETIRNANAPLEFYQKVLLLITCLCALIVMIQNRKNLSLELLFLITIFIGGFAFHILWETKSRYIIPYILVLIPVASVEVKMKLKKLIMSSNIFMK